jgi:hypothetical protein
MALLHKASEPPSPPVHPFTICRRDVEHFRRKRMHHPTILFQGCVMKAANELCSQCVPQALATFEMPVSLSGKIENVKHRIYILADGWDPSPFRYFAKKYTGAPGWDVIKLPSGHDVMVDMPTELAAALAKMA